MLASKVLITLAHQRHMYLDDKHAKCLKNSIFSLKDSSGFVVKPRNNQKIPLLCMKLMITLASKDFHNLLFKYTFNEYLLCTRPYIKFRIQKGDSLASVSEGKSVT